MIRALTTVDHVRVDATIFHALHVAEAVWRKYGTEVLWITALRDGTHKPGSLHYEGRAADIRVKNLPRGAWETATAELQTALGPQYDVLLELDPPHVHIEFDPKPGAAPPQEGTP